MLRQRANEDEVVINEMNHKIKELEATILKMNEGKEARGELECEDQNVKNQNAFKEGLPDENWPAAVGESQAESDIAVVTLPPPPPTVEADEEGTGAAGSASN